MKGILDVTNTILRIEVADKAASLVAKILLESNPVKMIFAGADAAGIFCELGKRYYTGCEVGRPWKRRP